MPAPLSQHTIEEALMMWEQNTLWSLLDIAKHLKISHSTLYGIMRGIIPQSERSERNRLSRRQKNKRPISADHRTISKREGYYVVPKPEWYTGTSYGKQTEYEHRIIGCEKYGLTEIPEGYVIHHKDENKRNNDPDNLLLMSRSDHNMIHNYLRMLHKLDLDSEIERLYDKFEKGEL